MRPFATFVLLCVASLFVPIRQGVSSAQKPSARKITEAEVQNVVEAVQDEIYDYGYARDYYQIGDNLGTPEHWIARIPIYIDPKISDNGGLVIYRYMHYTAEVYRGFAFDDKERVVLDLDPELGFPPTQASTKTIYMDDEDVCRMKHDWLKRTFMIDTKPPLNVVEAAARRQFQRVGYSYWQLHQPHTRKKQEK